MNKIKNIWMLAILLLTAVSFVACEDDSDDTGSAPITIEGIYLQDAESKVPDRKVDFVRKGQTLRIAGTGFTGMRKVYINGYETYFNPVYVSDNSMLLQIDKNTPLIEADVAVRNKIRLTKSGTEAIYDIQVRDAAPSISRISHTLPQVGEPITIYGSGLTEVSKVVFPGDIVVSEGIVSDPKGKYVIVTMPNGVSENGGSLFIEGSNGGAYSPAYFNFKKGLILNFDGVGTQGAWDLTSMIHPEDLESAVIGIGNTSQGTYCAHRPAHITEFAQNKNRQSEVWTADENNWSSLFSEYIPLTTPLNQVAFQFDIFVPEAWSNTGFLKILLYNSYNGGEWNGNVYNYIPWIDEKKVIPFQTEGWVTVTIPFNKFYNFSDTEKTFTFQDVITARNDTKYKNFGIYFENSDFKLSNITGSTTDEGIEFPSSVTSIDVYTDNWRVVSIQTPSYSDFPETAE
ncbi:MAG: hypothetical protein JXR39_12795 [Marinilabiliaceae bacterium]|nr:hypothetical protein [Marinilabiliaceae bacterium]